MKEIIIVAGECSFENIWLRSCLDDSGYSSIHCETAEEFIEELLILPANGVNVQLVIIGRTILENLSYDEVNQLCECAPEIPFILLENENSTEAYERICANRVKFDWEGNPLAKALEGAGVEVNCGRKSLKDGINNG
jgi:hypothetical protein